jgi:hypothetical protein
MQGDAFVMKASPFCFCRRRATPTQTVSLFTYGERASARSFAQVSLTYSQALCKPNTRWKKANSPKGEDAKPPVYGSVPKIAGLPAVAPTLVKPQVELAARNPPLSIASEDRLGVSSGGHAAFLSCSRRAGAY